MDLDAYTKQLQSLFPRGFAWNLNHNSNLTKLLKGLAEELVRVHKMAERLFDEADPIMGIMTIVDWERMTGIDTDKRVDLDKRRTVIAAKMALRGGQTKSYFSRIANLYQPHSEINITEYKPFRIGKSIAGDPVNNERWTHIWKIEGLKTKLHFTMRSGEKVGRALNNFDLEDHLIVLVERFKPAHSIAILGYKEER